MVVPGVVEHHDHLPAPRPAPKQRLQEGLERGGVELRRAGAHELAAGEAHRPKAGDRLARRRVQDDRGLVLGRNPHAAPCAVALEVALILAPQLNVLPAGQEPQFF